MSHVFTDTYNANLCDRYYDEGPDEETPKYFNARRRTLAAWKSAINCARVRERRLQYA